MGAILTNSVETVRRCGTEIVESNRPFEEKVQELLRIGKEALGVENGHYTNIDRERNYWRALQSTDSLSGEFPPGLTLSLDSTYCRRTVESNTPVALHNAKEQDWDDDVAYQTHGLDTYLGISLQTTGETEGTLCFVSDNSRTQPFSQEELRIVEFLGFQVSSLIQEQYYKRELQDRERLMNLIDRILRHNLRNDLTVVNGYAQMLGEMVDSGDANMAAKIMDEVDDLISTADKVRTLQGELSRSFERDDHDIEAILKSTVSELSKQFPHASINLQSTPESPIELSSRLEIALHELIENAAKYSGTSANVSVDCSQIEEAIEITITDDGPGIPDQELIAVRNEQESPLAHGSGVGLTLASMIVVDHGGELTIETKESGTTVYVHVPLSPTQLSV